MREVLCGVLVACVASCTTAGKVYSIIGATTLTGAVVIATETEQGGERRAWGAVFAGIATYSAVMALIVEAAGAGGDANATTIAHAHRPELRATVKIVAGNEAVGGS